MSVFCMHSNFPRGAWTNGFWYQNIIATIKKKPLKYVGSFVSGQWKEVGRISRWMRFLIEIRTLGKLSSKNCEVNRVMLGQWMKAVLSSYNFIEFNRIVPRGFVDSWTTKWWV